MTSNAGAELIRKGTTIGFASRSNEVKSQEQAYEKMKENLLGELKKTFRPEFLNRVDGVVVFHSLTKEQIRSIVDLMLTSVTQQLSEKNIKLGYVMVLSNGEVNPCMLLQVRLGNVRERSIISIWENSPVLAKLRHRESLKGECKDCAYTATCSGCRGRAYEETGDMMAADPGCWLAPELTKRKREAV